MDAKSINQSIKVLKDREPTAGGGRGRRGSKVREQQREGKEAGKKREQDAMLGSCGSWSMGIWAYPYNNAMGRG